MLHVSIIIVHYRGVADTVACLKSIKGIKHPHFTFSVVVVDNGSKEALELPQNQLPKRTTVVRSDTNLGFTSGNNLGLEQAIEINHPDYVLLLNNDTTVDPDFLSELLKIAENNPNTGMVSPLIYFSAGREFHQGAYSAEEQGRVIWYAGGNIDWSNLDCFHRGVDEVDREQFIDQTESEFATGCCVLIPHKILERVGLLDPKYFLYLEDVDWSMRIKKAGFKLYFAPKAHIWHNNAGSTGGSGSGLQSYYQTRNRLFFFQKYANSRHSLSPFGDVFSMIYYLLLIWKFAIITAITGTSSERKGARDWILGKMGKETLA